MESSMLMDSLIDATIQPAVDGLIDLATNVEE
jgi:hypothetical protein